MCCICLYKVLGFDDPSVFYKFVCHRKTPTPMKINLSVIGHTLHRGRFHCTSRIPRVRWGTNAYVIRPIVFVAYIYVYIKFSATYASIYLSSVRNFSLFLFLSLGSFVFYFSSVDICVAYMTVICFYKVLGFDDPSIFYKFVCHRKNPTPMKITFLRRVFKSRYESHALYPSISVVGTLSLGSFVTCVNI